MMLSQLRLSLDLGLGLVAMGLGFGLECVGLGLVLGLEALSLESKSDRDLAYTLGRIIAIGVRRQQNTLITQ